VTLEGVPRYFLPDDARLISIMRSEIDARHFRLSLGVQSFDPRQLERMGRQAFGDRDDVARVVDIAHEQGMTVSADLLINLPSQTAEEVIHDIEQADGLGFDQVCLYQLVLYPGLGTAWSLDEALLAGVPALPDALRTWQSARGSLLERGFVQSTVTNFERAPVARSVRRFEYERCSFRPDVYDAVGFGPGAISTFLAPGMRGGRKLANCPDAEAYGQRICSGGPASDRAFDYAEEDLRLLFITRSLPLLAISRPAYRHYFGSDIAEHFPDVVRALSKARLIALTADSLQLTDRGMFYADSVAGLFAWRRAARLRRGGEDDAARYHMG
jgi:oxygen-independent coproporphyrinogen-3 oxidase